MFHASHINARNDGSWRLQIFWRGNWEGLLFGPCRYGLCHMWLSAQDISR